MGFRGTRPCRCDLGFTAENNCVIMRNNSHNISKNVCGLFLFYICQSHIFKRMFVFVRKLSSKESEAFRPFRYKQFR